MIRVAAYCRVSTDKEDQIHSLESQKKYFYEYINRRDDWELTNIYADEGITGTNTKKRLGFLSMLKAAYRHEIDLIITKEISRFARNTLDSIYYSRVLKELGIGIFFLNDNINTMDADAELRLTILSSIAQEESRKTSERVKWGQKRSMERGVVFGRDLLGYDVREGKLYINEEGAKIVRLIFHKFVTEEKGTHTIAKELTEAGIPTLNPTKQWYTTVILRILRNEKYCGDLAQKKTYTPNYLEHKKKRNEGEEDMVIIKNHHEPIISRELFMKAQEELHKRTPAKENRQKYSNRYGLSGIIKCATCGSSYVYRKKKTKGGKVYSYWRCYEAVLNGKRHFDRSLREAGCNSPTISEDILKGMIKEIIVNLGFDKAAIIKEISERLQDYHGDNRSKKELSRLEDKLNQSRAKQHRLIELYILNEIDKKDFLDLKEKFKKQIDTIEKEVEEVSKSLMMSYTDGGSITDISEDNTTIYNLENGRLKNGMLESSSIEGSNIESSSIESGSIESGCIENDSIENGILANSSIESRIQNVKNFNEKSNQVYYNEKKILRIDNTEEYLDNILCGREWNDTFYRQLINRILVYEGGKVEISFKYLQQKFIYHIT